MLAWAFVFALLSVLIEWEQKYDSTMEDERQGYAIRWKY